MVSQAASPGPVLRLTLLWREAVVDSFAITAGAPFTHELRTFGPLTAEWDKEGRVVVLTLGSDVVEVPPGGATELSGFTVRCRYDELHPRATRPLFFDGRWLHALILAAAFQLCVVSAMLLTPTPVTDPEPGAGLTMADVERFLAVPIGGAPREGRATFAPRGEAPEEGERVAHERPPLLAHRTPPPTVTWSSTPAFLSDSLDEVLGDEGALSDLARVLGDDALSTARSEQATAGVGGILGPRPLVEPGAGNGTVGIGASQTQKILDANDERLEELNQKKKQPLKRQKEPPVVEEKPKQAALFPVQSARVPEGEVTLDPVVKDFLASRMRDYRNSVRYCYETFGLAADPGRGGRVVLELTLLPDGHVSEVSATASHRTLDAVGTCVVEQAQQWFLGDGFVQEPQRLRFPFRLCPKSTAAQRVFCREDAG